jgi:cell division septation protein DedD
VLPSAPRPASPPPQLAAAPVAAPTTIPPDNSAAKNKPDKTASVPAARPPERRGRPSQARLVEAPDPVGSPSAEPAAYWVQVGTFTNPEAARRVAALFRDQEPPESSHRWVVAVERGSSGAPLARVRVGPFPDQAAAQSKLREFESRGYKPTIAEQRN